MMPRPPAVEAGPTGSSRTAGRICAVSDTLFDRHRDTLDKAVNAIRERGFFSAYPEVPSGKIYGETAKADGQAAFVLGTIRWGRTDEQKAEIVSELRGSVATALGCAESEVGVVTVDIPSKWNMEGGSLLPEPGEEEAWLEQHRA